MTNHDIRAAFETLKFGAPLREGQAHYQRTDSGGYHTASIQHDWEVWQACAASLSNSVAAEQENPYAWINAGTQRQQTEYATLNVGPENPWKDGANAFPVYTHPASAVPQQYAGTRVRELECVIADLTRECKELRAEAARQPAPAISRDAETWLRERYGAARGHHAWRDLEEAFNAGQRAALAATAAPVLSDDQIEELARKHNLDGSMLHGSRMDDYVIPFARDILAATRSQP